MTVDPKNEKGEVHKMAPEEAEGGSSGKATDVRQETIKIAESSKLSKHAKVGEKEELNESPTAKEQEDAPFISPLSPVKKGKTDSDNTIKEETLQKEAVSNYPSPSPLDSTQNITTSLDISQLDDKDLEALGLLHNDDSSSSCNTNHTGLSAGHVNEGYKLYDDIYGLIYFANPYNQAFWFAVIVFVIQVSLLLLIYFDMVQVGLFESVDTTNGIINRIALPVAVPISVTIAQFLGLVLSVLMVASEGDLTRGMSKFFEGFKPEILEEDPDATKWSWALGAVCQTFVGIVMTADSVVLLVRTRTVIELCLNFAALHFVQEIDDIAFSVASRGLITSSIQKECQIVTKYKTLTRPKPQTIAMRRVLLLLVAIGTLIPYIFVVHRQWSGYFLCEVLYVQFDDVHRPDLEAYSGIFDSKGNRPEKWMEGRMVYYDKTGSIRLSYCETEKSWVFSDEKSRSPCQDYFIKSFRTESFDVMEVAGQGWSFHNVDTGEVAPMGWLAISCNDCEKNELLCKHGKCEDRQCTCDKERMGLNCEFPEPTCSFLYLDYETSELMVNVPAASVFFENEYVVLTGFNYSAVTMNYRPVYVSKNYDNAANNFAFLVFSGRRWILFGKPQGESSNQSAIEIVENIELVASQHPVDALEIFNDWKPYQPLFFSAPVNFGTISESVEPTNIDWVHSQYDKRLTILDHRANDQKGVSARFLCSDCNDITNPCLNSGVCSETKTCDCSPSYEGPLCETCEGTNC